MNKKDTQNVIGTILTDEQHRDAIHIAVLPVICDEDYLTPGEHVRFSYGCINRICRAGGERWTIGIVDPFLEVSINKGDKVFLFLKPNSTTGLRHEWISPVVDKITVPNSPAEAWLREFAFRWCIDYDELVEAATQYTENKFDAYITSTQDLHNSGDLGEDHTKFWENLELLTGRIFGKKHRENFGWSCSCG